MIGSPPTRAIYQIDLEASCPKHSYRWEQSSTRTPAASGPVIVFTHGLMMDGSLWRHVVAELRSDYRCVLPTLPLGGHRHPMRVDADLSMRGVAKILGELIERLDLRELTLAMSDWGGPQLLVGGPQDERISRLVDLLVRGFRERAAEGSREAAPLHSPSARRDRAHGDAVSLRSPAQAADDLRPAEQAPSPARGDGPLVRPRGAGSGRSAAICASTCSAPRRVGATCLPPPRCCTSFDRPVLVAWAREDRLMPREHGRRLADLCPQGRLVEIADSYTLIPEDQPAQLAKHIREFVAETRDIQNPT